MKDAESYVNRGNNLMPVAFLGVLSLSLINELFMETDLIDKLDDALIIILAIIAVVWYFSKDNKFTFSYLPLTLVAISFVIKVIGIMIEFDDQAAVGDDFGISIPLLAMIIITFIVLRHAKKHQVD